MSAAGTTAENNNAVCLQVPLWTERVRGLPNAFARSALFCIGARSVRRMMNNVVISSVHHTEVRYTGEELRQDDQDLFLQLVSLGAARKVAEDRFVDGDGDVEASVGHRCGLLGKNRILTGRAFYQPAPQTAPGPVPGRVGSVLFRRSGPVPGEPALLDRLQRFLHVLRQLLTEKVGIRDPQRCA